MNKIPVAFAFDNNLAMPAAVCFYSLFANALPTTVYDIFVLHRKGDNLDMRYINKVMNAFQQHNLTLIEVGETFDNSYEVREITTPTFYRLLIPKLIPQYDKVLYSDVDVIFREDLSSYYDIELENNLFGGVNALVIFNKNLARYYQGLNLCPSKVIYAGNLIINSKIIRGNHHIQNKLITLAQNRYKYQDMDVINIVSKNRIRYIRPSFCVTTDISQLAAYSIDILKNIWNQKEIDEALKSGIVHYNGQKPWKGWCVNFDIWWEYYRKSPVFDPKFYFDFFYSRLNEHDMLPLWKRIKILLRYFVFGRKRISIV